MSSNGMSITAAFSAASGITSGQSMAYGWYDNGGKIKVACGWKLNFSIPPISVPFSDLPSVCTCDSVGAFRNSGIC